MNTRERYLPLALRTIAFIAAVAFYPLTVLWPSGWAWHTGSSEYLQMIIAIYATLGVFLWFAARRPSAHLSLISFAIWSSIVHGAVMAVQALSNPMHIHHLYGDVLALFAAAGVLGFLCPKALNPAAESAD